MKTISAEVRELAVALGFVIHREKRLSKEVAYYADARGEPTDETYFKVVENYVEVGANQCSLQQWIMKTFNIRIFPTQKVCGDFGIEVFIPNKDNPAGIPFNRVGLFTNHYPTYEDALEYGLLETLKNKKNEQSNSN